MEFFEEFNHLLGPFVAFCGGVTVIGAAVAFLRKHLLNGVPTIKDLETGLESVKSSNQNYTDVQLEEQKEIFQEKDDADKKWLNTLQDKVEANQKDIAEIKGELKGLNYN